MHSTQEHSDKFTVLWPNIFEGNYFFDAEIWNKHFSDWFKKCSDGYIFSVRYKLIHFCLSLSPIIQRMGNGPSILCSNCKKREKSHLHFTFYYQLSQTTLDSISKLININFSLNSPSKMCLKDIIMGSFSHFHDGVQL